MFFLQLIDERYPDHVFFEDKEYLDIRLENDRYACILFEIDNIQTSYQQAREMLENKFLHGSNRVYSFTEPQYSQYYFPLHLEDQLIQSVKMGNTVAKAAY